MRSSFVLALALTAPVLACSTVAGDSITAADLARVSPAFAALDPQITMAPSPLAGAVRLLHPSELLSFAGRHHLTVEGSLEDLCFERPSEFLSMPLLEPVLAERFAGQALQIEDFSRVRIPLETGRAFEITSAASNMIRGRVTYAGGHSVIFWVRLKGAKEANPGLPLRVLASSSRALPSPTSRFPSPSLRLSSMDGIERGEPVSVEVRSGAARLAFASTAESSGHTGESVLVRNPQNGKLFQAKVQSKGKVLVQR